MDEHIVEITLCTNCLFEVGNNCLKDWCDTGKANAARELKRLRTRRVIENERRVFARQESIRAGLKR